MGGLVCTLYMPQKKREAVGETQRPLAAPLIALEGDLVALPYEQAGGVLSVPITVEQDSIDHELWMIFDTGATFSTINRETLHKLGLEVSEQAPIVTLRTANGVTKAPLVILNEVWIGGYWVGPLTVALCEPCASSGIAGLLGLNLSSGFLLTLDPLNEEILLQPRGERQIKSELSHWISLSSTWGLGGPIVQAHNRSEYPIKNLEVTLSCIPEQIVRIPLVPPQQQAEKQALPGECSGAKMRVTGGLWGQSE